MKNKLFLTLGIIFLILSILSAITIFFGTKETVFPDLISEDRRAIVNLNGETNFIEGQRIYIRNADTTVSRTDKGYAVWVDDQLCDTNQVPAQDILAQSDSNPNGNIVTFNKDFFNRYGLKGNPDEVTGCFLSAGEHLVEVLSLSADEGTSFITKEFGYTRKTVNVATLPCVLDDNQFLAEEIFVQGETFDKSSLVLPMVKTCSVHAPIVVDSFTLVSDIDLTILSKLNNNQKITVPENQLYKITYVVDDPRASKCSAGEAYNIELNLCEQSRSLAGIIQLLKVKDEDEKEVVIADITTTEATSQLGVIEEQQFTPAEKVEITVEENKVITIENKETGEVEEISVAKVQEALPIAKEPFKFNYYLIPIGLFVFSVIFFAVYLISRGKR